MPEDYIYSQKSPKIEQSDGKLKKVIFYYFNPDASDVNFVSFLDKWNQFTHQMYKNQDGYWEFTMDCKKGYYYYYFLADDKKVIDIENPNKVYDDIAGEVSVFIIE
jgi:1,4-alpha-glucan branching enzyme